MEKEILNIRTPVVFDESIAHYAIHAHTPYASSTFNNSDEIRITVQHQELCILPSKSSVHIDGRILKPDGTATVNTQLVNNAICHLFEEIRCKIDAVEINRSKNVGLTGLMKGYASLHAGPTWLMKNAAWLDVEEKKKLTEAEGNFDVLTSLSMIFGFANDYRKIVVNAEQELILTRSKTDVNAMMQTQEEEFNIKINAVEWLIPYLKLADQKKVDLLNFVQTDAPISMSFRSWKLYECPLLLTTSKHVWTMKTSTQLEKSRHVILLFQTSRKHKTGKNASHFDHCDTTDVKLFSNS
ncbi:uncharacterized protein [Neodiprion pinetum]|uniref:uncharacterized protein n=1 Tax=Neodiprion pinetum TaxID=441929 RepID=UPI003715A029